MTQEESRTDAIPEGGILLHIGPHKTGTSSLQAALRRATSSLQQEGVEHVVAGVQRTANRAARAIQRLPYTGPRESAAIPLKVWTDLVEKVHASKAERIVISGEEFSASTPSVIKNIVDDLGPQRLHVVITLRSLDKVLTSQWQTDVRSAGTYLDFASWLKATLRDSRDQYRIGPLILRHRFWYRHRHDLLIQRWASLLSPGHLHIVISKDNEPEHLFRSFEQLLGLKVTTLNSGSERKNRSLDADQIEVVRRVVRLLHQTIDGQALLSKSKKLSLTNLVVRAMPVSGERKIMFIPSWASSDVSSISDKIIEAVSGTHNVMGSLTDLLPHKAEVALQSESHRYSDNELEQCSVKAFNLLFGRATTASVQEASPLQLRTIQLLRLVRIAGQRIRSMLRG